MRQQKADRKVKIVVVGDSGVGKTNLTMKLCKDDYKDMHTNTIGVDMLKLHVTNKRGEKVQMQFWDTAGQERYRTVAKTYLKGADAVIFVHSVVDPQSLGDLQHWVNQISANCSLANIISVIVANKIDLNYQFEYSQSQKLSLQKFKQALLEKSAALEIFKVSAKTNANIEQLKKWLIQSIQDKYSSQNPMGERPIYLSFAESSIALSKSRISAAEKHPCC